MAVTNFTNHNLSIFDFPDPAIPVPYTELLINAMPGYRKATAAGAGPFRGAHSGSVGHAGLLCVWSQLGMISDTP